MFQFAIYIYIADRFKVAIRINKYRQFIYIVAAKHDFKTILLEKMTCGDNKQSWKFSKENYKTGDITKTFFVKRSGRADDIKLKSCNISTSTRA